MVFVAMAGLGVLIVLAALLGTLGGVVNDRARARTAADAAALAGAASGRTAAEAMAVANGGVVEDYRAVGDRTTVTVRVGRARATSTAERSWRALRRSPLAGSRVSGSRAGILYTRGDALERTTGELARG
jgi:hypothetical protein